MTVTLENAKTVIEATLAKGVEMGLKPLSAVVVDAGGYEIAFARQDGASPGRFAIAKAKAYGSVMLGMAGTAQMARADQQAYFMTAVNGLFNGQVIPVPGGILIKEGDVVIGALGVTGDTSDNDAEAGLAGLAAAGLTGEG